MDGDSIFGYQLQNRKVRMTRAKAHPTTSQEVAIFDRPELEHTQQPAIHTLNHSTRRLGGALLLDTAPDTNAQFNSTATASITTHKANPSPEIEFVSARRLSAPQRRPDDPQRPIDLDLIDNDFEIISERPATPGNGANGPPPADSGFPLRVAGLGGVAAYRRELAQRTQALHVQLRGAEARLRWAIEEVNNRERQFGGAAFVAPQLDFMGVGFDMGLERERSASPIIVTPPPPAEGFTRSPVEGDVLVCPNCGDELALGREALKRQVWIIRACGHVYCGECTAARSKSRRKGKEPAKSMPMPFKVCVVESCGKKCSSKTSMLQLFL
ncbi:hypothetical protein H2199_007180 [Coniosporium tulheliwenetii]|uniref:Uncharacterized protein n=1 Tax=Coniosporium tulheliwenetii TaxID=3383036 RepID=A0ACC2YR01_9PEZI|nr:hypothetical protein H2199_007180 [Cladosporium sp. JES 115]